MPRINRRSRAIFGQQARLSRPQLMELLIGPNGRSAFASETESASAWKQIREKLSSIFADQWHAARSDRLSMDPPRSFAVIANDYAQRVVAGEVPVCEWVRLACQRHIDDLVSGIYDFDTAKADRACRFIELLPHVKGSWAANSELVKLEPWQIFIVCMLFGWVKKASRLRRFSLAYIEVARKNAKSTLAAGIGLYMFACDAEFGAEVYSGATTADQAHEVYRPARQMMVKSPELAEVLGLIPVRPTAKGLGTAEDRSRFEPVIGKPGDGASPHCGIVDEYHEHDSDVLFDTFRTGMGARQQPLLLVITTAGDNTAGPCKLLQGDVCDVLNGLAQRDEVFGIIYSIDPGDDWSSDVALVKANPNIGVSVFPDFLVTEQRAARANARKQGVFQTKHLCVWVGANAAYFNLQAWKELGDTKLFPDAFLGQPCVCAVDLSTKRDLTARILGFKKLGPGGKYHYYFFSRFWLPEETAMQPENQQYQKWATEGFLRLHSGSTVDFEELERDVCLDIWRFKAKEFAFDPWNAAQFSQGIQKDTKAKIVEIPMSVKLLSAPTKELDSLIAEGRVHHDANPVLAWMIGNVVAHEDANENVFPRKEPHREEKKIDGAIAVIMALSRLMTAEAKRSVYASRGILTLPGPMEAVSGLAGDSRMAGVNA